MIGKSGKLLGLLMGGMLALPAFGADKTGEPSRWILKDRDTTIHFIGTIHALPDDQRWLSESTRDALYASDTLVLEVPPGKLTGSMMTKEQEKKFFLPAHTYLDDVIDEDLYKQVAGRMEETGLPVQIWGRLQPWVVADLVYGSYNMDTEFNFMNGVEMTLLRLIESDFKNVIGLESENEGTEAQLVMYDEDGEEAIRVALREGHKQEAWALKLVDAWKAGDDEALAALDDELESNRKFQKHSKALLEGRNRHWVKSVKHLMRFKGTYFVAVGAGHMTGENNLMQLLAEEGLVAERVSGSGPVYEAPEGTAEEPAAEAPAEPAAEDASEADAASDN